MLFRGQYGVWAASEFYGWNPVGLGAPSAYPNDWILLQFYRLAEFALSPVAISKLTVVAIPAVAAFGAYWLLRSACGTTRSAACLAALAAALSPTVFNKLVSGQLAYVWALALLPCWLSAYRQVRGSLAVPWALTSGCIAAVMSAQIQFVIFIVLLIVGDVVFWRSRAARCTVLAACATTGSIAIVQYGTLIALASNFGTLETSLAAAPAIDWVRANSPTLESAFELRGYVTHYFEYALAGAPELGGGWVLLARLFLICLAGGAVVAYRRAAGRMAIATFVGGALLAAGLNAPGSALTAWLYENLRPMQLFREVYHWSALSGLGATMLLGFAADALIRRPATASRNVAALCLLAVVTLFGLPSLDGEWSGFIQTVTVSRELRTTYERIAAGPSDLRVLWWPIDQPMSESDGGYAGLDPMSRTAPPSMSEYILSRPSAAIVDGIRHGDLVGLPQLLRYAGVGDIVYRSEIVSRLPEFLYNTNDDIDRAYGEASPSRAMISRLGWRIDEQSEVLDAYHAPYVASIVDSARGFARISPLVDLLPTVPVALSPVISGTQSASMIAVCESDLASFIASYAIAAREPLRGGIIFASGNASIAWARADSWWYFRDLYARVLDITALSLRRGDVLRLGSVRAGERIVVGTIASPYGRSISVLVAGQQVARIATHTPTPELHSIVVTAPASGELVARNDGGEEALRDVKIISAGAWRRARDAAHAALRGTPAVAFALSPGEQALELPRRGMFRGRGIISIDGAHYFGPELLSAGSHDVHVQAGGGMLATGPAFLPVQPPYNVRVSNAGTLIEGSIAAGVSAIRLRSAFHPSWTLHLADGEESTHSGGDLFGNAWTFRPIAKARAFRIDYEPAVDIAVAHRVSAAAFSIMLIVALTWWPVRMTVSQAAANHRA